MGMQLEQLELGLDLFPPPGHLPAGDPWAPVWAARPQRPARRCSYRGQAGAGERFALYGRASTVQYQHGDSSLGWQRDSALDVIADRGRIVVEFFDVGYSRRVPWARRVRPRACCRR
jgi:site-specific DNA recombinase